MEIKDQTCNFRQLTLTQRTNILDGITLYEPVDLSILDKLINSTLLKETFNNPICKTLYANEKIQLLKYKDLIENGRAVVQYKRYKNNPYGRSNPNGGLGLFTIRREIRHTLAKDEFEDIDIDNCHPTLLQQIMEECNEPCPLLTDYIKNRNEWLELVRKAYNIENMEIVKKEPSLLKDIPKNLFIRILFSGGIWKWKKDYNISGDYKTPQKIKDLVNEIKRLNEKIAEANNDLVEIVKKVKLEQGKIDIDGYIKQTKEEIEKGEKKRLFNLNGSVSSFFLQEKEIIILEQIFIYCKTNGYIKDENCILCADGLMIQKVLYKPELLKQLNILIKIKTGFNLNFSRKGMDQDYLKILDKNLNFDLYTPTFTTGLIANYFRIMYSNKFLSVNGQVYIFTGNYWKEETDKKNATIHNFIDTTFYKHLVNYISGLISKQNELIGALEDNEQNKDKLKSLASTLSTMTEFLKNINCNLRTIKKRKEIVEDIVNKITCNYIEFDNNPHLLAFTNKIFNLQTGEWIEPKYNQYITITTGWDWCDYYPDSFREELDKILDTIFPIKEVKQYYLMALSTGLYGQQIEKIFIANGAGGNGKSLINSLMMTATGNYGYKLPSNVLLNEIKEGANPAIANMNKKRFCLTQEPDGKKRICSATLKEITGDPTLNCRTLYSKNTLTTLHLSLFLECNELPKLDEVGVGVERRTEVIPFISRFVDESKYNEISENDRKELNIMKGNPFYKTEEFKHKYKQALIIILLEQFKQFRENEYQFITLPKECKEKARDYMATSDDIYSWFSEYFEKEKSEIKDKDKNFIYFEELYEIFTTSKLYENMTKKDKQTFNQKTFYKKITDNLFLQPHIKPRDSRYGIGANGKIIVHKKPYIINFVKIQKKENNQFFDNNDSDDDTDGENSSLDN